MTQFPLRRLAAATVVALALSVLALPAAAAPAGAWTLNTWELPTFLSWFDSVWSGWFGVEQDEPSGPSSIHGKVNNALEPDGLKAAETLTYSTDSEFNRTPHGGS